MSRGAKTTKTQNQQASSTSTGLEAAQPFLLDLLNRTRGLNTNLTSTESGALSGLAGAADQSAGFAPQIAGLISDQFAGGGFGQGRDIVNSQFGLLSDALSPVARGDFTDPTADPILNEVLTRAQDDAVNRNRAAFSAGGRSFSPAESRAVGEGVADVTARTLLDERGRQESRQFGALDRLFSGGLNTANFLDATTANELGARQGAVGLLPQLTNINQQPFQNRLAAEEGRFGIEAGRLGALRDLIVPISATGRTADSTGTSTTTTQKQDDPLKTLLAAGLGTAGLLSGAGVFGPAAAGLPGVIGQSTVGRGGLPPLGLLFGQ